MSFENATSFLNPQATGYQASLERSRVVQDAFAVPEAGRQAVEALAAPEHIQATVDGPTLIYSGGGDGTVNRVVAAIIGNVQDDPEASATNQAWHSQLAPEVGYLAGADGNANNFALSALGHIARHPARAAQDRHIRLGLHRPLLYEITDERGDIVRSGIVTNCVGLGAAALAAEALDEVKPELKQLPRAVRLGREALIAFGAVVAAPAFSVRTTLVSGRDKQARDLSDITGFESIGSAIYAKQGRTRVNIDDSREQFIVTRKQSNQPRQALATVATLGRVKTGRHALPAVAIAGDSELALRLMSDQPVPFHVDGEIGGRYRLEPGQTLQLRRSGLAVPTFMI